jgi:hypothetical protein
MNTQKKKLADELQSRVKAYKNGQMIVTPFNHNLEKIRKKLIVQLKKIKK